MLRIVRHRLRPAGLTAVAAPALLPAAAQQLLPSLAQCVARAACASGERRREFSTAADVSNNSAVSASPAARPSSDGGVGFSEGRPTAPRPPRGREAYEAAHAPAPLDPTRPPPRNPLRRLLVPEPEDLTQIFGNLSINWSVLLPTTCSIHHSVSSFLCLLSLVHSAGSDDQTLAESNPGTGASLSPLQLCGVLTQPSSASRILLPSLLVGHSRGCVVRLLVASH
jgi:hypothetical protein